VGELRNMDHYKHSDYREIMEAISAETEDEDLLKLFAVAEKMHASYYHNFIRKKNFPSYTRGVEELIRRLIKYIGAMDRKTAEELAPSGG